MSWEPASAQEVQDLVSENLNGCTAEEAAVFLQYAVPAFRVQIRRYGELGTVVAVAKKENEVLFWEDYECGFVISRLSTEGIIEEYNFNQDSLSLALRYWMPN